jgi:hypothetical protein
MPTFVWTTVTDAAHSPAGHFTIKVTDKATGHVLTIPNVTGTSYTLGTAQALTPGHGYTWSVTAVSSNGQATVGSGKTLIFAIEPMAAPVPSTPAGVTTTDMPTLTWLPLVNAKFTAPGSYVVVVTDKATGRVLTIGKLAGTSYRLMAAQALTPGHTYRWSVAAVSTNGLVTASSSADYRTFMIEPLGAPTLSNPTGTLTTDMPTFTWAPVLGANNTPPASYTIDVTDKTSGRLLIIRNVMGSPYTLTAAQALTPGHAFNWSVAAVSTNGQATIRSINNGFTVAALTAPILVSVSTGSSTPTFTWQSVTDANHYYLKILDSATGQVTVSVPIVVGTSYTLSASQAKALKPGHAYRWFVAAVSTNDAETVWSGSQVFTIPV